MKSTPEKKAKKRSPKKEPLYFDLAPTPDTACQLQVKEEEFDASKVKDLGTTKYLITTNEVFSDLENQWQKFDRKFLQEEVQQALQSTLLRHKVVTYRRQSRDDEYFKKNLELLDDFDKVHDETSFPFADYFIAQNKLVSYHEEVIVSRDDPYFPLLFALTLALLNPTEARSFLDFHLQQTFEGIVEAYQNFIHDLFLFHTSILDANLKVMAEDFLRKAGQAGNQPEMEGEEKDHVDKERFTKNRKILFMHYMFQALKVNRNIVDTTDMARVAHGLIEIQPLATKIKNTDVYKRLGNPLMGVETRAVQKDLMFVRNQFELLGLKEIAEVISKEIHLKE